MVFKTNTKSGIPKIGFCAAFKQGYEILTFALKQKNKVNFVATSNRDNSEFKQKIIDICKYKNIKVFENIDGNENFFISFLINEEIDIVILSWWPSIINLKSIKSVNIGWINLVSS